MSSGSAGSGTAKWPEGHGQQADAVAGGQGELRVGRAEVAAAQNRDGRAGRWPGDLTELSAAGGRVADDGDLDEPVSGQRGGRVLPGRVGVGVVPVGGELGVGGAWLAGGDLAGDGAQHAGGGDPALDLVAVGGQHGQAIMAVDLQLPQRLGDRLDAEQGLRVALVDDRPGQGGPVRWRTA